MTVDINKIKVGDPVIVKTGDIETFKTYKAKGGYPGYNGSMEDSKGTVGVIQTINFQNNSINLSFADGEYWTYLPEWVSYFKNGIQEVEPYELPKPPEPEFKIGDIVFINDIGDDGTEGYGKVVSMYNTLVGVRHYTYSEAFHTCDRSCPDCYGWFYSPEDLELAELP